MDFETIRKLVETRLSNWTDAPVAYDNVAPGPSVQTAIDNKSPWIRLTINHGDSFTSAIGSEPCVRRTGLIQCQLFTDERVGTSTASTLADSLAGHLQYWYEGGLSTQAASLDRVGPSDGWYNYVVTVPFRGE